MNDEFTESYRPGNTVEQVTKEFPDTTFLKVGEKIFVDEKQYVIERITLAADLGERFGLRIPNNIPVYWLSGVGSGFKGAFVPEKNIVLFFENTDQETQHHELTHVVEYFQEKRVGLMDLYERVKSTIADDSFEGNFASYNFRKNIHEFIADGRSKPAFIAALKKEGLYDAFVQETAYLF